MIRVAILTAVALVQLEHRLADLKKNWPADKRKCLLAEVQSLRCRFPISAILEWFEKKIEVRLSKILFLLFMSQTVEKC